MPLSVHSRVDDRITGTAIFSLNMKDPIADFYIRVKAGTHSFERLNSSRPKMEQAKIEVFESSFDRLHSGRYYNSAQKMNANYLDNYGPLLLMFVLACGLAGVLIVMSTIVGRHKRSREKDLPYECGIRPTGDAREPISVQFYMVALLFILFDIEAIFLYPWALIYSDLKVFGFVEMLLYILILLAGYIFLWKKGALDWSR
jgi:NADH-quinone oxidoreductase subunit A